MSHTTFLYWASVKYVPRTQFPAVVLDPHVVVAPMERLIDPLADHEDPTLTAVPRLAVAEFVFEKVALYPFVDAWMLPT